jgi:hypothetical protein
MFSLAGRLALPSEDGPRWKDDYCITVTVTVVLLSFYSKDQAIQPIRNPGEWRQRRYRAPTLRTRPGKANKHRSSQPMCRFRFTMRQPGEIRRFWAALKGHKMVPAEPLHLLCPHRQHSERGGAGSIRFWACRERRTVSSMLHTLEDVTLNPSESMSGAEWANQCHTADLWTLKHFLKILRFENTWMVF